MSDADVGTALLGTLMPLLIALVNQWRWPPPVKGIVALLVCGLAATAVAWLRGGQLDWHDWRRTALIVTGAALASYRMFWQPTQIAPRIEAATSLSPGPPPPR